MWATNDSILSYLESFHEKIQYSCMGNPMDGGA